MIEGIEYVETSETVDTVEPVGNWIIEEPPENETIKTIEIGKKTKRAKVKKNRIKGKFNNDDRQKIIGKVMELISNGRSNREIKEHLKTEYNCLTVVTQNQFMKHATTLLQSTYDPRKFVSVILARCDRIYEEAMYEKQFSQAIEALKLQSKLTGIQTDVPEINQNIIQISY